MKDRRRAPVIGNPLLIVLLVLATVGWSVGLSWIVITAFESALEEPPAAGRAGCETVAPG